MGSSDQASQSAEEALRESEYRYRNLFQAMAASFWELDFTPVGAMMRQLRADGVKDYAAYFAEHPEFVRQMMHVTRVIDVNDQTVALFGRGDKAELLRPLDAFWPEESNHVYATSVIAAPLRRRAGRARHSSWVPTQPQGTSPSAAAWRRCCRGRSG